MIDSKTIREAIIKIGDEHELGAMAFIAVDSTSADIQFLSNRTCAYRLAALRMLLIVLRELVEHVECAIVEVLEEQLAPDPGSSN